MIETKLLSSNIMPDRCIEVDDHKFADRNIDRETDAGTNDTTT